MAAAVAVQHPPVSVPTSLAASCVLLMFPMNEVGWKDWHAIDKMIAIVLTLASR